MLGKLLKLTNIANFDINWPWTQYVIPTLPVLEPNPLS